MPSTGICLLHIYTYQMHVCIIQILQPLFKSYLRKFKPNKSYISKASYLYCPLSSPGFGTGQTVVCGKCSKIRHNYGEICGRLEGVKSIVMQCNLNSCGKCKYVLQKAKEQAAYLCTWWCNEYNWLLTGDYWAIKTMSDGDWWQRMWYGIVEFNVPLDTV